MMVKYPTPGPAPHQEWNKADDHEDRPWCSGEYHASEQVPEAIPPQNQ